MSGVNGTFGRVGHTTVATQENQAMNSSAVRTGAPRPQTSTRHTGGYIREPYSTPRMPLDTGIHWTWRNPLNIIPGAIIVATVIDIIAFFL